MKLVVAEKPGVAQSLAAVLGAKQKKQPLRMVGLSSGSVIWRNLWMRFAPSMAAASNSSSGNVVSPVASKSMLKGTPLQILVMIRAVMAPLSVVSQETGALTICSCVRK